MNKIFNILFALFCFYFSCSVLGQNFSIIGNGITFNTSTTTTSPVPLGNSTWGKKHQMLITAAELSSSGIPANSTISSIGFNIIQLNSSTTVLNNFNLKVFSTNLANPIGTTYVTTGQVATTPSQNLNISNTGWIQITLGNSFTWNGVSNLVIETCYNNSNTTTNVSLQNTTLANGTTWTRFHGVNTSLNCTGTYTTSSSVIRSNLRLGWYPPNPTSIVPSNSSVCQGDSTLLTANGSLGIVYWYSDACGGTPIDSGTTIFVTPSLPSTTYYAKNFYNGQFSINCTSATINVNPLSVGGLSNSSQSICYGTAPSGISLTNYVESFVNMLNF
jgi:hypothetical protein